MIFGSIVPNRHRPCFSSILFADWAHVIFDRFRPFVNSALGKIRCLDTLVARAEERRVLHPMQTERVPPSIFLPGQLELATKVIEGGNLDQSRAYLAGTTVTHGEVVEYITGGKTDLTAQSGANS